MTVTYVYCFSLSELSKSNMLIWYHSICLWIHFSQKHLFFTIFKRNDLIFSQFSKETRRFFYNWSGTEPLQNFGKKRCITNRSMSITVILQLHKTTNSLFPTQKQNTTWTHSFRGLYNGIQSKRTSHQNVPPMWSQNVLLLRVKTYYRRSQNVLSTKSKRTPLLTNQGQLIDKWFVIGSYC